MARKTTAKARERTIRSALGLKRVKDRYLRQCALLAAIAVVACVAPYLILATDAVELDPQLVIAIPVGVMLVAGMIMSKCAMEYQRAKRRFDEYCKANAAVIGKR